MILSENLEVTGHSRRFGTYDSTKTKIYTVKQLSHAPRVEYQKTHLHQGVFRTQLESRVHFPNKIVVSTKTSTNQR